MSTTPRPATHGILVAVLPTGKTLRIEATSPSEFLKPLSEAAVAWLNFEVQDLNKDGERIASLLGFSGNLIETLQRGHLSAYEDRDTELGMLLPVVRSDDVEVNIYPLVALVRENFVLTIHETAKVTRFVKFARYAEVFMRKIPQEKQRTDRLTILLTRIIDENNERNFDGLRRIQERGDLLAGRLVEEGTDRRSVASQIYDMKHALIVYLDALWASLDVIQSLRHGDAELITDDETQLARVALLGDDVNRHIQLSEHMSEVLVSGLEVLQSIYNNQLQSLNNRMSFVIAWLTILGTAVLVPNTLATIFATGVYGLGEEDRVWFTLVLVGSTVLSTLAAWLWVRRRGGLPKRVE